MILSDTDTLMYSCGSTVEYHRLVGKPNKPGMGIERERGGLESWYLLGYMVGCSYLFLKITY